MLDRRENELLASYYERKGKGGDKGAIRAEKITSGGRQKLGDGSGSIHLPLSDSNRNRAQREGVSIVILDKGRRLGNMGGGQRQTKGR